MKKFVLLTLQLFYLLATQAQLISISSTRLDELRLKMPLDTVNKILGTHITINNNTGQYNNDTIWVQYKNNAVRLVFDRYTDGKTPISNTLTGIYTTANSVKTGSGIKTGDDKFDVIKKLDGRILKISPDWHYDYDNQLKKMYSAIVLYDYEHSSELIFYFYNNKLYAFECNTFYGEDYGMSIYLYQQHFI
jgi:hypothetical protein